MGNDNSRKIIIDKALSLFSAHGYDGTGVQDITAAAGVTKPTLYYFFGSKDGLFEAVWETFFPLIETPLAPYCTYENHIKDYQNDVYGQLVRIVLVFFRYAQEHADFYRLMMETVYAPPESKSSSLSTAYFKRLYALLEQFFAGAAEAHGNMAGKARQFAVSFLAEVNAYVAAWLAQNEDDAQRTNLDEACAQQLVKQFMHGIFA
ncbi:MAG TPA: TetR/AcrR family transcriptional regulator [Treponema sp.]|nr:TetR/AcrR family transcriptional regulator [Treponema sp.]